MQNLVSCHFASQVESGMEEHWEWENLGSKKKIGVSTRNYYYGFTLDEFMGSTGNGVLIYLACYFLSQNEYQTARLNFPTT